jgi:hypothetical protein
MKKGMNEMRCVVYRPSDRSKIERAYRQNEGVDIALDRLEQMRREDPNIRIVDAAELSEHERDQQYIRDAAVVGSFTRHAVRRIFGSNKYLGTMFGIKVPAVRVEGATPDDPGDIYPHEEVGRVVTILDFLNRRD